MTQHGNPPSARMATLLMIICLAAAPAGAQTSGNGVPSAREIWRHLPALPGQPREAAPEPAPPPAPAPAPSPKPAPSAAPRPAASNEPAPRRASPAPTRRATPEAATPEWPRTLAEARVVIHYPERGGYERSQELVRLLRAVGTAEVESRAIPYAVDRQSIRYFHAADQDVTGRIADLVGMTGGGGRETVSDFTTFRPTPRNGTIEIWLPETRF